MQGLSDEAANEIRRELFASQIEFTSRWVETGARLVVPVEEFGLMSGAAGERLIRAFVTFGVTELFGLTTTDLGPGPFPNAVRLGVDAAQIESWREEEVMFNLALVSTDLDMGALMSVDEFALIAGPAEFVESALGKSIPRARADFLANAEDMASASRHLPGLARAYGCL